MSASETDIHGGRVETRTIEATTALNDYLDWPHLAQACRLTRIVDHGDRVTHEVSFKVTSLTPLRADGPRLLELARGHWRIENGLHYVRDVTFDEDRSQVRTGAAPQVMAALRNTAIGVLRQAGFTSIAAGLRRCAARPEEALTLLGVHSIPP